MNIEMKLKELGFELPPPPPRGGVYTPIREFGDNLAYASGFGTANDSIPCKLGKLGKDLTLEEGQQAAQLCILNLLSALKAQIGDFSKVKKFVKLLVLVSSDNEFFQQPQVANGASNLLVSLFGEEIGLAARSAIGVNVLPGNIPVEIEALIELQK